MQSQLATTAEKNPGSGHAHSVRTSGLSSQPNSCMAGRHCQLLCCRRKAAPANLSEPGRAGSKSGNDFVAPQFAFVRVTPSSRGFIGPPGAPRHEGVAAITMDVDAGGKVLSTKIAYEHPPGMRFGRRW